MAAPKYKLYYFDIKGLAEPLRYILSYANIDFEDVRVSQDDWPALKPSMPLGQMPVLEVDGKHLHQTIAVGRYLAKKNGLSGANPWEDLQIDIIVDTINDFRQKIGAYHYEQNLEVKEKILGYLNTEILPFYLEKLEQIVKDNNGHFALNKLTWADIFFAGLIEYMNFMAKRDLTESHPGLRGVVETVNAIPQVKSWIERRPVTEN